VNPPEISALAARSGLDRIWRKVETAERLSRDDVTALLASPDLLALGAMADFARARSAGDEVYFISNRHINHTNVCRNRCLFCAFSHDEGDADAYTLTIDQVVEKARETLAAGGISEIHIVGGEHPDLPFSYYLDMMRALRELAPDVHIQAFTASEISHFARISGQSVAEVLEQLKEAGLGSLPGGGAEVFSGRVRDLICERKISGQTWLDVHRAAHEAGMVSNATMLYGHVERPAERIAHLVKLREHQDASLAERPAHFNCIVPLSFIPAGSRLAHLPEPTGLTDLRTLAVTRLMLDNVPHVKAFWVMHSPKLAQVSLNWGVDDIDGTVIHYEITQRPGPGGRHQELTVDELKRLIIEAGGIPVERDTLYRPVARDGDRG